MILILFSPHADASLRIAAAKAIGRIRPIHPYVPDQLIEALYKNWRKANYEHNHRDGYRVVVEIAKALAEINPKKLIETLYDTGKTKPDTVGSSLIVFPIPIEPEGEKDEILVQFLKSRLLAVTSDQPESKPVIQLPTRESKIRHAVEYALKKIHSDNPDMYRPLINSLIFNENFSVHKQAADSLWDLGDTD